jgi:hypothetical protein
MTFTFTGDTPESIANHRRECLARLYYPTLEATDFGRLHSPHLGTVAGVRFYATVLGGTHDGYSPTVSHRDYQYRNASCLAGIDPETMSEVVVWRERDAADPRAETRTMLAVGCVEASLGRWADPAEDDTLVADLSSALGPVGLEHPAWTREGRLIAAAEARGIALPAFDGFADAFARSATLARDILLPRIRAALPELLALADRYLPVADALVRDEED